MLVIWSNVEEALLPFLREAASALVVAEGVAITLPPFLDGLHLSLDDVSVGSLAITSSMIRVQVSVLTVEVTNNFPLEMATIWEQSAQ